MKTTRHLLLTSCLALAACAPSPLYVGSTSNGTPGEVPRDNRGEPIWAAIPPAPPPPAPAPNIVIDAGPPIQHLPPAEATITNPSVQSVPVPQG